MLSQHQIIELVIRASMRSARSVHGKLNRGLPTLKNIAAIAPLIGFAGTIYELTFDTFKGYGGGKETWRYVTVDRMADALVFSAVGILVGVIALLQHKYLSGRLEELDSAMTSAATELGNFLSTRFQQLIFRPALAGFGYDPFRNAFGGDAVLRAEPILPDTRWTRIKQDVLARTSNPWLRIGSGAAMLLLWWILERWSSIVLWPVRVMWPLQVIELGTLSVLVFLSLPPLFVGVIVSGLVSLRSRQVSR